MKPEKLMLETEKLGQITRSSMTKSDLKKLNHRIMIVFVSRKITLCKINLNDQVKASNSKQLTLVEPDPEGWQLKVVG